MARIARAVAPGIPHYVTQRGNRRLLDCHMSSISLLIKIEFAISLIVRCHYILWSSHFQTVNSKVNNSYITHLFDL